MKRYIECTILLECLLVASAVLYAEGGEGEKAVAESSAPSETAETTTAVSAGEAPAGTTTAAAADTASAPSGETGKAEEAAGEKGTEEKDAYEGVTKEEVLKELTAELEHEAEDVFTMVPDLGRATDDQGKVYFTVKSGDSPPARLEDLDRDQLIILRTRINQARVVIQSQRVQQQVNFISRNIQTIQNMQNQQRQTVPAQAQVPGPPQVAKPPQTATPPQPPTVFIPPPPPRRQER